MAAFGQVTSLQGDTAPKPLPRIKKPCVNENGERTNKTYRSLLATFVEKDGGRLEIPKRRYVPYRPE
jgi:hypothetical protein